MVWPLINQIFSTSSIHLANPTFLDSKERDALQKLGEITNRLVAAMPIDPGMDFYVTIDPHATTSNASSMSYNNRCSIIFNRGIFNPGYGLIRRHDENEMATILSHEIGHCLENRADPYSIPAEPLGPPQLLGMASLFSGLFPRETAQRNVEARADLRGLFYMMRAGYDPLAAVRVWVRASSQEGNYGEERISDHPAPYERAQLLRGEIPNIENQIYSSHRRSPKLPPLLYEMLLSPLTSRP